MAQQKKKKTTTLARKYKTGLSAVPMENFDVCKRYFYEDLDKSIISEMIKTWIKKTYSKEKADIIFTADDYHFSMYTYLAATIYWMNHDREFDEKNKVYPTGLKNHYDKLLQVMTKKQEIIKTNTVEQPKLKALSTSTDDKINATIMTDLDVLEDEWIAKKETSLDLYTKLQKYSFKASWIPSVKDRLERWLSEYEDAYFKRCDQAVEAYSHLSKKELKRRVDCIHQMLNDLQRFKSTLKVTKVIRSKKKTPDKQVLKLNYLKSSEQYKIISINPILIPESTHLYCFNEKTRVFTLFVSQTKKGLEVKGSTIIGFDSDTSKSIKLRNPDVFLTYVLDKNPEEIQTKIDSLTTKPYPANGRINKDTLLLRAINKK